MILLRPLQRHTLHLMLTIGRKQWWVRWTLLCQIALGMGAQKEA
jgi:hypothetical protein